VTATDTCTECAQPPMGSYVISLHGELTCATHVAVGHCLFCGRPQGQGRTSGWVRLNQSVRRCPTCARDAVDDQVLARRLLPVVRQEMAHIGIQLDAPVRVTVIDPTAMPTIAPGSTGPVLGITRHQRTGRQLVAGSITIQVIAGLPPMHFGQTVAHELGHAWLAQRAVAEIDDIVEEGVCELFAHAWLKRQPTPMAGSLRAGMHTNPNPVYGNGFRMVHAAVAAHGIDSVLRAVCSTGTVPRH
jgi:hypothetical protein